MTTFRVGIIGCGRPWRSTGASGFGMGHAHAAGYRASPHTEIVALADLDPDNARAFQAEHGGDAIYTDYREMLERERLDIVSICTWPHLHEQMVRAAAEAGVRAIHCEKPMAPTLGEARAMVEVCERHGVQLTFNHQRRFGAEFRAARDLLRSGAVGKLERMEASCDNLFDWGTHWFDMLFFFNDEAPVEWVIGQIDARGTKPIFGVPIEGHGISHFRYSNGVYGLLTTGYGAGATTIRLAGSDGLIDIGGGGSGASPLRVLGKDQPGWQTAPIDGEKETLYEVVKRGVLDLVDALRAAREPELSSRRALQATELIFATYESSRRRGRVDLPLTVDDSPFLTMLEQGELTVAGRG